MALGASESRAVVENGNVVVRGLSQRRCHAITELLMAQLGRILGQL